MLAMRHAVHALVGGFILFAWAAFAHTVLGLGGVGLSAMPAEAAVLPHLQSSLPDAGLYLIPGDGLQPGLSASERDAALARSMERARQGPAGLLLWHPSGHAYMSHGQFAREYIGDALAALLASVFLTLTTFRVSSFWARTGFVSMLGVFASLVAELPLWNWYGFPSSFLWASMIENCVGFTLVGLFLAWRMKPLWRIPAKAPNRPSTQA